jgi:hypothetical protein
MKFSGGKGQGLPPHVWLERWNAARNVVPHVAGAEDYTRIADDVISYVKAVNEAKSAGHGIISAGAGARALHLSGGDPQAELYLTGSVKDAVAAIEASGVQAPTAGIVARMRERATRAAAGDAVPNLTGAEKRMVAEIRATENAGVAGDKLTAARDATVGRIAERGRKVGAAEGEKLGKAEQRARVLENILRSSEARGPRLVAKRESAIKDAMGKVINPEEYMPRIFTKEGRAALARAPEIASRHGMAPSELKAMIEQGGHLRERTLMRNAPAAEVEKVVGGQLRAAGALKGNMLEHDALQLMGKRAALGEKAVGEAKYLQDLTKLKTPAGERILMHEAEGAAPAGWATVDAGPLGKFHAPLEVAKEINQVRDVIVNDEALKEFHGLLGKLNTLWKGYATVPLVGGAGFHARNAQGNVWLNFLAGVKNPVDYARATKLQMAVRRAGGDVSKLSLKDRTLIDLAKKHGVIDEGFFLTDLGERSGKLGRAAKGQKLANVGRAINPLSTDNVVIRSGRSVGSAVENNARLAHFIAKLGELGSADEAARSVRKYLFDYGDLTPTERSLKKVVAFWTFMRKNAPLQAAEFARQPGKFAALAHGRDAAFGEFGNDTSLDQIPAWLDYAKKRGDVPMKFAGHTFLVSPDLPATSAINTVEPDLAGLYGRFGGFLPSLAKLGAETITQRSLFTGAPVKGSGLTQGLEALLPLFGKIESSPYYAELSKDPQKLARLLSSLTGLNVRDISNEEGKPQVGDVADQIPFTAGAQR